MKKSLLKSVLTAILLAVSVNVSAQKVYDFRDYLFDMSGDQLTPFGVFYHVSANGKYAVGYDDQVSPFCYFWCADKPDDLELLWDIDERYVSAHDVSNDGTVVGSWEDWDQIEEQGPSYPAYKPLNGEWTKLPVPDNYSIEMATSMLFVSQARAITPDGRFIAGNFYIVTGFNETFGWDKCSLVPCLWENGELKKVYDNLGITGFMVWDISNDGSTIVGMNTADTGGQNPAIIRNDSLINILDCGTAGTDTANFNGGVANSIDAKGNVYGYFQEADGKKVKYFKYTKDNKLVFLDQWVACHGGGKDFIFGQTLTNVLDCSEDGSVLVGGGMVALDFGVVNAPMLALFDKSNGIDRARSTDSEVSIDWRRGDNLYINGEYNRADIYSASGALIKSGAQGHAFNMNNVPTGTYIVRVTTDKGTQSFKIAK